MVSNVIVDCVLRVSLSVCSVKTARYVFSFYFLIQICQIFDSFMKCLSLFFFQYLQAPPNRTYISQIHLFVFKNPETGKYHFHMQNSWSMNIQCVDVGGCSDFVPQGSATWSESLLSIFMTAFFIKPSYSSLACEFISKLGMNLSRLFFPTRVLWTKSSIIPFLSVS